MCKLGQLSRYIRPVEGAVGGAKWAQRDLWCKIPPPPGRLGWRLSLQMPGSLGAGVNHSCGDTQITMTNPGHPFVFQEESSFRCPFLSVRSPGYSRVQPCFSSTVPGVLELSAGAALSALPLPYVMGHTAAWSIRAFPEDLFLCSGIK